MLKFTTIRTDKQNKQHLKLQTIEDLMKSAGSDFVSKNVQALREYAQLEPDYVEHQDLSRLPVVYPSFEAKADERGDAQLTHFNGILTLSIGQLDARRGQEEAESVKHMAAMLPMTVAALVGSSGRTVKVLVRICRPDGTLPQGGEEAERLCRQAYPLACRLYAVALSSLQIVSRPVVTPALGRDETNMLHAGFRMSYDYKPCVNPNAAPLLVPEDMGEPNYEEVSNVQENASFIATANVSDLLTDPSGSRRFIGVELTGPINMRRNINHRQLYPKP